MVNVSGMSTPLPALPEVERLSPRVIRILGGNPGRFTLQGTNTYLVGTSSPRLLIDTGEGKPSWRAILPSQLKSENTTISKALITHWHLDHVGGSSDLRSISPDVEIYQNQPDDGQHTIVDGQVFSVPGATVRAFYCPGHTKNHMAFILEEENAMFTGDNVLGHGTAVFEDLAEYMKSLDKLKDAFTGRAYPGHGAVIEDGPGKVREYISHRQEREQQVLKTLGKGPKEGMTSMEIVEVVYEGFDPGLFEPARKGVVMILKKLEGEGKVEEVGHDRWRIVDNAEHDLKA